MKFSTALIALISATVVAAVPSVGLEARAAHRARAHLEPRYYAKDAEYLEPYDTYHERYLTLGCRNEHGKAFFDTCCHPLLKDQTEDDMPDSCWDNLDCDDNNDDGGASSVEANYKTYSAPAPAPSTSYAPKPSSSAAPKLSTSYAPKPSTTYAPKPSSSAAAPAPTSPSGDDGEWNYGGQVTYFEQQGHAGACGIVHSDSDLIAAIDQERYGYDFGVQSPYCGKTATVCRIDNLSKCVTVTFADVCPGCEAAPVPGGTARNSIDLSVAAFQALGNLSEGVITVRWKLD